MATSRFIATHINNGEYIAHRLDYMIDRANNSSKTQGVHYVTEYGCNASIADAEFF